jgi:hypothetical protein
MIHVEVTLMPPIVLESEFTARAEKLVHGVGVTHRTASGLHRGTDRLPRLGHWSRTDTTAIHDCFK